MVNNEISQILAKNPILSSLSADTIEEISKRSVSKTLSSQQQLFVRDEPAKAFYFLKSGRIKLYRLSQSGDEKILEIIEPNNLFAFTLLFIDGARYPVTASALVPSEVIAINSQYFSQLLKDSTELCFKVMAAMSSRMMGLIQEIDDLSLQSGSSRVAAYLLSHTSDIKPIYQLPVSKKTLASRLSIKPETLSRLISCLITSGAISVRDKEIEVLDRQSLSSAVCPALE